MRKMTYPMMVSLWVIFSVLTMAAAGCGGTSKPSNFYLLRSMPEPEAGVPKANEVALSVLIGPITLPAYLDRAQIVTLEGDYELAVDEFTRWAEPLRDTFYRVLVENLSVLLNTPKVYAYDSQGSTQADFQITIDVTRFDTVAGGGSCLTAFWAVVGKGGKTPALNRKSIFHAAAPSGIKGLLGGQNRTLTEFSREIAEAIQSLKR
jgi:uncharacterized lipoprotein YmbA